MPDGVYIVTGAGSGIGRAIARELLTSGAAVALVGRRLDHLQEAAGDQRRALCCPADISDPALVSRTVQEVVARFGRIDGLVNNAGIARFAPVDQSDLHDLDLMLDVHVRGPILLIQACLPYLRASGGSILTISSVGGDLAMPNRSLYGATKAAQNSLTKSLALELAPLVRVNAILPGPVTTPMYGDLGLDEAATTRLRAAMIEQTPMKRFGTPDEVARWATLLLDPKHSAWITGALIPVDGGRTAIHI